MIDSHDIPERPLDPPEGEEPEPSSVELRCMRLSADLGTAIRKISDQNAFDKGDLIDLLKRSRQFVNTMREFLEGFETELGNIDIKRQAE